MPILRTPANGPPWLPAFASSIIAAFKQKLSAPFWLWGAPTADLPTTPELGANEGALAYDETTNRPTFYDGVAWNPLSITTGTVTSVSVVTANGVSGSVANPTTTPAITITLGAITPSSVAASGTVTGSNLSGTNTGDQTTISGNAATATILQTARNFSIGGGGITAATVSFNGSAAVVLSASVDPGHITLARMADIATDSFLGRDTAGTGNVEELSVATVQGLLAITTTPAPTNLTLATGWTAFGGAFLTPAYRKALNGLVTLEGIATGDGTATTTISTLPVGFRPSTSRAYLVYASGSPTIGVIVIDSGGVIALVSGSTTSYVNLDQISFYV